MNFDPDTTSVPTLPYPLMDALFRAQQHAAVLGGLDDHTLKQRGLTADHSAAVAQGLAIALEQLLDALRE